jgi:hypothetical protein
VGLRATPTAYKVAGMRWAVTIGVVAAVFALALTGQTATARVSAAASCSTGTAAPVGGKVVCLRKGARCRVADDRQVKRFGYRCRRAKARHGRKRPKTGKLVLINPSAARYREEIRVQPNGTPTKEVALEAFAAAFGPLPGVKVSKEDVSTKPTSGTSAIRWIQTYRSQLTQAQRDAVDKRLAEVFPQVSQATSDLGQINKIKDDMLKRLENHLGPLGVPVMVETSSVPSTSTAGDSLAEATMTSKSSTGPYCWIVVFPSAQAGSDAELASTLTHELFHCFQFGWGSAAQPDWLLEGSAEWAASRIDAERGYTSSETTYWWDSWLEQPHAPLFNRTYSAVGFYAHMAEDGIDPWKALPGMIALNNPSKAYESATTPPMLDNMATGYFRTPELGPGWDFTGPGIPQTAPKIPTFTVTSGSGAAVAAAPRATGQADVTLKTEVVEVSVDPGETVNGRVRDADGNEYPLVAGAYCAKAGGCTCPNAQAPVQPLRGKALVGVTGGSDDAVALLEGETLKDYCKKAPPKTQTHVTIGGAYSGKVTEDGICDPNYAHDPGIFRGFFTSDEEPTAALNLADDRYKGPGKYAFANSDGLDPREPKPTARLNVGVTPPGQSHTYIWETEKMPKGSNPGFLQITSQTADTITGTITATALNDDDGSTITVSGTFTCDAR